MKRNKGKPKHFQLLLKEDECKIGGVRVLQLQIVELFTLLVALKEKSAGFHASSLALWTPHHCGFHMTSLHGA